MRLIDLNPRWLCLEDGGPRVGLSFDCPHCRTQRLAVCFHHHGRAAVEDSYILAYHGTDGSAHIWDLQGQEDFETLTLSPSIDASASGHWHGFIHLGDIC
jgi:hypothetical protein